MSPDQASFFVPVSVLGFVFASFFINIRLAKKRVANWKRWSTYWFVRSNGLFGINNRAASIWVKRLGYGEAEALLLAKYQSQAIFFALFGGFIVMLVAWKYVER